MPLLQKLILSTKKNPINPTYAKPVVTYRTKLGHFLYPFIFTRTPTLPMHTNTYTHARTRGRSDSTLYHPPTPPRPLKVAPLPINAAAAPQWSRCAFPPYRTRCFWWSDLPWRDARCVLHLPLATSQRGGSLTFGHGALPDGRLHSPAKTSCKGGSTRQEQGAKKKKRVSACGGPCPHRRRRRRPRVTASSCGCCVLAARSCLTPGLS